MLGSVLMLALLLLWMTVVVLVQVQSLMLEFLLPLREEPNEEEL